MIACTPLLSHSQDTPKRAGHWALRGCTPGNYESIIDSLSFLPDLYPGADAWLSRKLAHIDRGDARCRLVTCDESLAGLTIETFKDPGVVKLSTIFVEPSCRNAGVATTLLRACVSAWHAESVRRAYVTVPTYSLDALAPVLLRNDFRVACVVAGRYGPDRDEAIFTWSS